MLQLQREPQQLELGAERMVVGEVEGLGQLLGDGAAAIGKVGLFIYLENAGTTQLVGLALGILAVAFGSM